MSKRNLEGLVERVFAFCENGIVLTVMGIAGGLLGLFIDGRYLPLLSVPLLAGLHRSTSLNGLSRVEKFGGYIAVFVVSSALLWVMGRGVNRSREPIPTVAESAKGVAETAHPVAANAPSAPPAPSYPVHTPVSERPALQHDNKRHHTAHSSSVKGSDNPVYTPMQPTPSIKGSGNTIIGATRANGNTLLNRGGAAIGSGATAGPTDVAIGANAQGGTQERPTNYDALGEAINRVIAIESDMGHGLALIEGELHHKQAVAFTEAQKHDLLWPQQKEENRKNLNAAFDKAKSDSDIEVAREMGRIDQEWNEASPSVSKAFTDAQNWLIEHGRLTHNEASAQRTDFFDAMNQAASGRAGARRFVPLEVLLKKLQKTIGDYQ